jgi:hypothetical protein
VCPLPQFPAGLLLGAVNKGDRITGQGVSARRSTKSSKRTATSWAHTDVRRTFAKLAHKGWAPLAHKGQAPLEQIQIALGHPGASSSSAVSPRAELYADIQKSILFWSNVSSMANHRFRVIRILAAFAAAGISASADQIVVNGGFETGNFSNWTLSGNTVSTGVDNFSPHSGMFSAFLGPSGSLGFLDQPLVTVAGQEYELSYFLQSDGGTPNEFRAQVNNTVLFDQTNIGLQTYTRYVFDFAASGTTDLKFGFRDDPGFLRLDDITVTSVSSIPEPSALSLMISVLILGTFFGHSAFGTRRRLKSALTSRSNCAKKDLISKQNTSISQKR